MQLLLAPSGRGKTAHVLQRIRALQATDSLAPAWVILPNRQQASAFRQRLAGERGVAGVEIFTFSQLYAEVLTREGRPRPLLLEPVQHRLLRGVVDSLYRSGALAHYAPLRDKPGFLRSLREVILDLKQARISPRDFSAALADAPLRLSELAAIYQRYQGWLLDVGWVDAEGRGWLAVRALERLPHLAADVRLLAVDGFDEFNPTQLAVLRLLAQQTGETIVTLTGEGPDAPPREAHRRFTRARQTLLERVAGVEMEALTPASSAVSPALAHLEAGLFRPDAQALTPGADILLWEARNRAAEARAALRWLKGLLVQKGLAPDQTAILARDLSPYRPFLAEAAAEFGMPLHLAADEALPANPVIAALLNLLSLPMRDWPQRAVLEAWRSPYFDWSELVQAEGEQYETVGTVVADLEAVVRGSRIIAGLEQWRQALQQRSAVSAEETLDWEDDRGQLEGPVGERAAALLRIFDAFVERIQPQKEASLAAYVAFVEDLIGEDPGAEGTRDHDLSPEDRSQKSMVAAVRENPATTGRDIAALRKFKEVLRGLLLAAEIVARLPAGPASGPVPYRRFWSDLRGAVEASSYQADGPERGVILAAPVLAARGLSFQAAAILGLSEGEFPRREQEGVLLRDADRLMLAERGEALPLQVRGEEVTLFYEAVTRAREHLLLTRPRLTDDGQPWEPSPYWQEVRRLTGMEPQSAPAAPAASLAEWLALAGPALAAGGISPPERMAEQAAAGWRQVQRVRNVLQARLARSALSAHEGDVAALRPRLQRRYHPGHVWSSSRLERYATCPFLFFVGHALRLEPRAQPEEGFDALVLGSIYHAILESVYRQARAQGDWSEQALLALLPRVAGPILGQAPGQYGFRPGALWEHQQAEMLQRLERTLAALAALPGDFAPFKMEQAFGMAGQVELVASVDAGSFRLRGFIDRIDRDGAGRLRIIDYKSGSSSITAGDLDEGKRIQLPLYALAAARALGLGEVAEGFYWLIGAAKPSSLQLGKYGVEAAMETATQQALRHIEGIRSGRFAPVPPAGGCPTSCPASGFCWRYRPRRR